MRTATATYEDFVFLSFRISKEDKEKFKLLAQIKGKSGVGLILDYVNSELNKPLSAKEIRKLPMDLQNKIWTEQSKIAVDIFKKHKELNEIPNIMDGIE